MIKKVETHLWGKTIPLKKNALRNSLHVKPGHKIPLKKLNKATHSSDLLEKRRAVLAKNFRKMDKKGHSS